MNQPTDPAKAYQAYLHELDIEIMHFRDYKCSFLPALKEKANTLVMALRRGLLDIDRAEEMLWDLHIEYMEQMQLGAESAD
jgi:hypothetical protein